MAKRRKVIRGLVVRSGVIHRAPSDSPGSQSSQDQVQLELLPCVFHVHPLARAQLHLVLAALASGCPMGARSSTPLRTPSAQPG